MTRWTHSVFTGEHVRIEKNSKLAVVVPGYDFSIWEAEEGGLL